GLQSRFALSRRPDLAAGPAARRGTASRRRRRRQSRGAIRARHFLQGGHRRREGHGQGGAAAAGRLARRQCRCRGGICHRDVQRHRHAEEPGGGGGAAPQGGQAEQPDRAKPPGARARLRDRRAAGQGRGAEMALDREKRRQGRSR
ncbi:hypothetical protein KXW38_002311, partial [Aspergillus fumigatus]